MEIRLLSYSDKGSRLAKQIAMELPDSCHRFASKGHCLDQGCTQLEGSLRQWTEESFREADALIFVCASGIAVRAIAPFVKSKTTDPAVLVVDDCGRFVISLLSGHLGGANELAQKVAEKIGAQPVITTATDGAGLFAVDVFAKKNGLTITSMELAKEVSAALLSGEQVGFVSDIPVCGAIPPELTEGQALIGIAVTDDKNYRPFEKTLQLIPRRIFVGMGCRRGKEQEALEQCFLTGLESLRLDVRQVAAIASIDVKKDEAGLLGLSQKYHVPFCTYTAQDLNQLTGEFTASGFVASQVGVDCVCERAAVMASGGTLLSRKQAENGVTIAVAQSQEGIYFE